MDMDGVPRSSRRRASQPRVGRMTESVMTDGTPRAGLLNPADEARRKIALYAGVVAGVIACRSGPLEDQLRQPSTPA